MNDCPGSCNYGYRKARRLHDAELAAHEKQATRIRQAAGLGALTIPPPPDPPQIQAWRGEPVWCGTCATRLRRQLSELDDLAAMLGAKPPEERGEEPDRERVSGSQAEKPSPSKAADDLDELTWWLKSWESAARGTDMTPRRGFLSAERTAAWAQLADHFDTLIALDGPAQEFGAELRVLHAKLTESTRAGKGLRHCPKPCPRCTLYALWEEIGKEYIRCANRDCGRMLSRAEYAAL